MPSSAKQPPANPNCCIPSTLSGATTKIPTHGGWDESKAGRPVCQERRNPSHFFRRFCHSSSTKQFLDLQQMRSKIGVAAAHVTSMHSCLHYYADPSVRQVEMGTEPSRCRCERRSLGKIIDSVVLALLIFFSPQQADAIVMLARTMIERWM